MQHSRAALGAVVLLGVLLTITTAPAAQAACGNPPEHCKRVGEACTARATSECIPPAKCKGGICTSVAPGCGNPFEHCKPEGAPCTPRGTSECIKPFKCKNGVCSSAVPPPDEPPVEPPTPPSGSSCILPVSPFTVNPKEGTPQAHRDKHPGETNYKFVNAVDLKAPAGTPVYAVEDGVLTSGGHFAVSCCADAGKWGLSMQLEGSTTGTYYFYTHVAYPPPPKTYAGATVTKGMLLGYVDTPPAGHAAHLHFATKQVINPCKYLAGCRSLTGAAPDALPCL